MIKIGAHVSAAGGVINTPINAHQAGCECFQFFSRPPQGGKAPELTALIIEEFQNSCKKYKLESYIHTPYYINLASKNNRIKHGSIKVIREEMERASLLGSKFVMTHLGSAKDYTNRKAAVKEIIKNLKKSLDGYKGSAMFLIENSAGSGQIIGADFMEIKNILDNLKKYRVGVCLDVMHAFASGYSVKTLIDDFSKQIGLKYLKLIHANDSKVELGSKKDRHENIGKGKIGKNNFKKLLHDKRLQKINFVLETPADLRAADLRILKKMNII